MSYDPKGGEAVPVFFIQDFDLIENGGNYRLLKGPNLALYSEGSSGVGGGWTVDYDALIPTGKDAFLVGPVIIKTGSKLTIDGELFIL